MELEKKSSPLLSKKCKIVGISTLVRRNLFSSKNIPFIDEIYVSSRQGLKKALNCFHIPSPHNFSSGAFPSPPDFLPLVVYPFVAHHWWSSPLLAIVMPQPSQQAESNAAIAHWPTTIHHDLLALFVAVVHLQPSAPRSSSLFVDLQRWLSRLVFNLVCNFFDMI